MISIDIHDNSKQITGGVSAGGPKDWGFDPWLVTFGWLGNGRRVITPTEGQIQAVIDTQLKGETR